MRGDFMDLGKKSVEAQLGKESLVTISRLIPNSQYITGEL